MFVTHTPENSGGAAAKAKRFRKSEDGGLLIFSLFLFVMMLIISGLAVDLMRTETERTRLQSTLDRSILAGSSLTQTLDAKTVVLDYFARAGLADAITADDITVVQSVNSKSVSAAVSMNVDTFFLNLIGIDTLLAPAGGTAEESVTDIEISLVVDTSGSMGGTSASGNTKIQDLQKAAKEFVYAMQCDPNATPPFDGVCTVDPDTVSISLIPYNEQVLLGETLIQQFNTTEEHTQSSCIDFDVADYSTIAVELDPVVADPIFGLPDLTPDLRRSATIDPWGSGNSAVDWRRTCSPYNQRVVSPYEDDYADLEVAIDALYASGYTSIELGMKWGAALLDPAFRPAVQNLSDNLGVVSSGFVGRPFNYDRPATKKVVVLMTDGKNTTQHLVRDGFQAGPSPFYINTATGPHAGHVSVYDAVNDDYFLVEHGTHAASPDGDGDAVQMSYPDFWDTYTWKYYKNVASDASLPNAVDQVFNSAKNTRLDAMCNAAKTQNITIYTMGFETSTASSNIMKACATTPSHHFDVDGTDIGVAFQSIARDISALRLTH
ncbi:MAG: Tad domain-containing protein [Marinosulfonomonas sp.]|nr:Tad domain-containing protein [Marinosulfonomonas sp.]